MVRKASAHSTSSESSLSQHSQHSHRRSQRSLHTPPLAVSDCDTDDEDHDEPMDDYVPTRPLSVALPIAKSTHHSAHPRRPNLKEILANTSPAPWTLTAFMAYLSNNHCLETLEFTMDAGRYKKHYNKMISKAGPEGPSKADADNVTDLWGRLIEAYIRPNGTREVNLPSEVRDPILRLSFANSPPTPETLDPAVDKIYELMEDSVLVPFLNSLAPEAQHRMSITSGYSFYGVDEEDDAPESKTYVEESKFNRRNRHTSSSPTAEDSFGRYPHSYSPPSTFNRKSAPSALSNALGRNRLSTKLSPTNSAPAAPHNPTLSKTSSSSEAAVSGGQGLTDDSGSVSSPSGDSPLTPPLSPPVGDLGSPRASRDMGGWKKLGRLSGWKPGRKRDSES